MVLPFIQGMGMGGGLIVAIGAQNAFVLSQGVRRNHHLAVAFVCALCDAILIAAGVSGVGAAVAANPTVGTFAAWGGAAFLSWYGFLAFRSMLRGGRLEASDEQASGFRAVIAATLAVTLLNPHVYLDTVVLLGSVSGQHEGMARYVFGVGAATASFLWFFTLSLGGQALAPFFRKQIAWRILDGVVCLTMWGIAAGLVKQALYG